MKHNSDGRLAEEKCADYLRAAGFKVLDKNWKTPKCEIDIVAQKNGCIYFVEVKFRANDSQGNGFEYITSSKLKQMAYAAEMWVAKNHWAGEFVLSGASVSGADFAIDFIEEI